MSEDWNDETKVLDRVDYEEFCGVSFGEHRISDHARRGGIPWRIAPPKKVVKGAKRGAFGNSQQRVGTEDCVEYLLVELF